MPSVYFRIAARGTPRALRAPLLERLIARADGRVRALPWRREAWRTIASADTEPPSIALAQLRAGGNRERHGWVAVATPVHLVAGMSDVALPSDGILVIDRLEADTLAAEFNLMFGDGGARLIRVLDHGLVCALDAPLEIETTSPEEALGSNVWAHQPRGKGSAQLKRLASEIEMWLFDHEVNAARRARGLPVISGLWFWGGGPGDAMLPMVAGWTAGEDALFAAFDRRTRYPLVRERSAGECAAATSGVMVAADWPGSAAWEETEKQWLVPALEDLEAGRLSRIEISAAATAFQISARGLRRFWRRSGPWWRSFEIDAAPEENEPRDD